MEAQKGTSLSVLHKRAAFFKKEYDLNTSLHIYAFLKWKEPTKGVFYLSPLLFKPCKIVRNRKIEDVYTVESQEDQELLVNPTLVYSFSRYFDVEFPHFIDEIDSFIEGLRSSLSTNENQVIVRAEFNQDENWQIIQKRAVGNFNYKKSLLGKDYEEIFKSPSSQIMCLLEGDKVRTEEITEPIHPVLSLDDSQKEANRLAQNNNLVIQGPPGTGKSHTIVGLIGTFLSQGKKVLFVSQKRSALEVVYKRLSSLGLGQLAAFLNTEKDEKKTFYHDLKRNWDVVSKPPTSMDSNPPKISSELYQFYRQKYHVKNAHLGCSYHELVQSLIASGFTKQELEVIGKVPSYKEWKLNEPFLLELESNCLSRLKTSLGKAFFTTLNRAVFVEKDPVVKFEKRLIELRGTLKKIKRIEAEFTSLGTLKELTQLSLAASILSMVDKTQLNLLNQESKNYKNFGNWAKKYQLLKNKVDRAEMASKNWKNKPTKTEIIELIDLLRHQRAPKGIFGLLKRKNERLISAFQDFDPKISTVSKLQLLEELRSEWNLKTELAEVLIKLNHNFNISDAENDIPHILSLRNKLNSISQNSYKRILEHDRPAELILALTMLHPKIQHFNHLCRFIFDGDREEKIDVRSKSIENLILRLREIKLMLPELQHYFMLPSAIRDFIRGQQLPVKHMAAVIAHNNLIEQSRFEPEFDRLAGSTLQKELEETEKLQAKRYKWTRDQILNKRQHGIYENELLLATPASKLSTERKEQKKRYRAIKKTMIHEMAKKTRHMPVKDFVASSWNFLSNIYPVWIMNTLSVSERLQCETGMFDVVIFDESSQIPLEDALPSIQRGGQIIVVGDDKQMPPGKFFSSHTEGMTLLDQAQLTFKNVMLKWHYRSEHPALIDFSNRQFYESELRTLPPTQQLIPIAFHTVNGIYENGMNLEEAKSIASYISANDFDLGELGIVAFSKEQENQIRTELAKKKISSENLMIRNLENIQGVEKDTILISIGYARNKEGVFRLNFGPVNQESGSNRLNVLFTRAKKRIELFSSVKANDFKMSDNLGVTCLRDYLDFAERLSSKDEISKPKNTTLFGNISMDGVVFYGRQNGSSIDCYIQHASGKVLLIDPCLEVSESKDLVTVYSVFKKKFNRVRILLMLDEWRNKDRFEDQFRSFFT